MNYIEWVDSVWQLLDTQWQRAPVPFALDVIRALPAVQANARTLDDPRAADPFACAREDLVALGCLSIDLQHPQLYRCLEQADERTGSLGSRIAPPPAPDAPQIRFLIALVQCSQVLQGTRVWLRWCGAGELCRSLGWGPAAVAHLETAVITPLEQRGLIRSHPAPGEPQLRPTYQGIRWARRPA